MSENSVQQNQTSARASNLGVKIPDNFESGSQYIPIAGVYSVNGADEPAIGQYTTKAPSTGTYVLGSINGAIQWIATESCDE